MLRPLSKTQNTCEEKFVNSDLSVSRHQDMPPGDKVCSRCQKQLKAATSQETKVQPGPSQETYTSSSSDFEPERVIDHAQFDELNKTLGPSY